MTRELGNLTNPRALSQKELKLVEWLLRHGISDAEIFLPQVQHLHVVSHCQCGCASIDFSVAGERLKKLAMRVLSDYQWRNSGGHWFGIFVFEQDGLLGGLEVWSIEGIETPTVLPDVESLVSLEPVVLGP